MISIVILDLANLDGAVKDLIVRNDSRLSRMLHVLLHMARHEGPMTSEAIGRMLGTNPVVVRRTMAGLRDAGYVRSEKGHGGGWVIAQPLQNVSLLDVHRAVGGPRLFAIGHENANADCAVEKAVNTALEGVCSVTPRRCWWRASIPSAWPNWRAISTHTAMRLARKPHPHPI